MKFLYKAKKGPTEIIEGEIEADNEDAILSRLSGLGLIPIKITSLEKPAAPAPAAAKKTAEPSNIQIDKAKIRIPFKELNIFTRQFAIMQRASVPLLRIFEILQMQINHAKFRVVLKQIQENMREGESLSQSLGHYPRVFSQLFINMIHSGEVSGTLDKVLMQLTDFSEKEAEFRSKVQAAIVYPLFLMLVGIGTIFVLLTFVMPRLMTLFEDLGTQLPTLTKVMLQISHFCQSYWMIMLGIAVAIGVWLRSFGLNAAQKKVLDQWVLKVPVLGSLTEKSEMARFLRSVELLYDGGIPLYQAVAISTKTLSNSIIREDLEKVPPMLEGGSTFAKSLEQIRSVSPFVTNMVAVGEESGQIGVAVRETAAFYEQETNQVVKIATSLLEPAMILSVGLIIGFIVISMLLPIFEIHVLAQ